MTRQLVTLRRIKELRPIPDADAIECAIVDGWPVVVKKGEFTVGDEGVYFEIDSFLPATDERFAFLLKNKITWDGREGMRLRTVKLRGQVSQGLILPVKAFEETLQHVLDGNYDTLADALNVVKYEPPIPASLAGEVEGPMPSFIRKTDEERVQNLPNVIAEHSGHAFEVTTKLDGTSMTVFYKDGQVGVCGRNWWFKDTNQNSLCTVAEKSGLLRFLKEYGDQSGQNFAVQGELMGEGIQGNKEKLRGHKFFLFNIWHIDRQEYLDKTNRHFLFSLMRSGGVDIEHAPYLEDLTLDRFTSVDDIVAFADGPSYNPDTKREGLVFKRIDGKFSFKAISNAWLLKHGE